MIGVFYVLGAAVLLLQQSECRIAGSRPMRHVGPTYYAEKGNGNAYIDKVLTNVRTMIYDKGMDPYDAIDKEILGVHIAGELSGLGTLHRAGEATITYLDDAIEVDAEFSVYDLAATLGWKTKFLLWTIQGSATATISESVVRTRLRADLDSVRVIVTDFEINHIGNIHTELEFTHIPGVEKITSLIIDAIANSLKNIVVKIFEGPIRQIVQTVLDDVGIPEQE